jgi:hypothetical protein
LRERFAKCAPGRPNLLARVAGSDLEREVERRVFGEERQQVVEHRDARTDIRLSGAGDVDAYLGTRFVTMRGCHGASERTGRLYTLQRWAERPMSRTNKRVRFRVG